MTYRKLKDKVKELKKINELLSIENLKLLNVMADNVQEIHYIPVEGSKNIDIHHLSLNKLLFNDELIGDILTATILKSEGSILKSYFVARDIVQYDGDDYIIEGYDFEITIGDTMPITLYLKQIKG